MQNVGFLMTRLIYFCMAHNDFNKIINGGDSEQTAREASVLLRKFSFSVTYDLFVVSRPI